MNFPSSKQQMYQVKRGAAAGSTQNGNYSSRHSNQPDSIPKALLGSSNKLAHVQQPATSNANYLSMKRVNHVVMNSMLNNAATNGSGTDLAAASEEQK